MTTTAPPHNIGEAEGTELRWGSVAACFAVDELSGAATFRAPLRLSPGRGDLHPELELRYDSRWGNGPFGVGWRMETPSIARRIDKEVPRYRDADEDQFEIDGDQLVRSLRRSGSAYIDDRFVIGEYVVQRYRRRHEGKHDRIERWLHQPSGQIHWRVVNANNVTSLFGVSPASRVADVSDQNRTGRWLLTETFDDRGNIVRYSYKAENLDGVDLTSAHEKHRDGRADGPGAARYLKRIQYGNGAPHERSSWHFEIVLDYGDHDVERPTVHETQPWTVRPDPFSDYRAGFEVRHWRRCRRVMQFHRFADLGEEPTLVNASEFVYADGNSASQLLSMSHVGFTAGADGASPSARLPPISFDYSSRLELGNLRTLNSDAVLNALVDPNAQAHWVDLHGEGLPGVMSRLSTSWYYLRNLGEGRFDDPELVVTEPPATTLDLESLNVDPESRVTHRRSYQPMTAFRNTANLNNDDPYIGYLDLNGDNADDVVVADDRVIRWYPSQGEEGFGDPVVLHLEPGEHNRNHRLYSDAKQSYFVADMTGDGLYDLVRVRSGEICYWPNQGRGRFGGQITMSDSPTFPDEAAGDGHVLLLSADGRSASDLIWVGNGQIQVWANHWGNRWIRSISVDAPGIVPGDPSVVTVDLTGSGLASLLWVDRSDGVPVIRYLAPAGELRPDLMAGIDNGRGLSISLAYLSSTKAWLRDRAAGGDWLTAMPEAVHMVEQVRLIDGAAKTGQLNRFAYHHGHYDSDELRFGGFAFVERWSTESTSSGEGPSAPVLTKTWRHTGTQFEDADLTAALKDAYFEDVRLGRRKWLSGNQLPLAQQAKDIPHAHRALAGELLRQEIYALDGPPLEAIPYSVTERNVWVRAVQPGRAGQPPCFDVRENESVQVIYERDVQEPRITHRITLAVDDWGYTIRSAELAYGRTRPDHVMQAVNAVTVEARRYLHRADQATWYRLAVPADVVVWELVKAPAPVSGFLYEARELRGLLDELPEGRLGLDIQPPHRRLVSKKRWRYWSNDMAKVLPEGNLESLGLPAYSEELAFTPDLVVNLVGADAAAVLLEEGGYHRDREGLWAPSPTLGYDATRFYVPVASTDSFEHTTWMQWDDPALFVCAVTDAYGNVDRTDVNYRVLAPWCHTDVNGNVVATRYDPLGMVLSTAVMGKPELKEADSLILSGAEPSAHDDPTVVVTYDTVRWHEARQPNWIRTRVREHHGDRDTTVQDCVVFLDGHERILWTATRNNDEKWLIRDAVERDGYGRVLRVAAPFHSPLANPPREALEAAFGLGHIYWYDALGRVVRADNPNGTFETSQYRSWSTVRSDCSDTVLESDWYAERQSSTRARHSDNPVARLGGVHLHARVAALASAHARTPTIDFLDAKGRVGVVRVELSGGALVEDQVTYDSLGRVVERLDRRGNRSLRRQYDLVGRIIESSTLEGGTDVQLSAADGLPLRRRNGLDQVLRFRYDACRRRTHTNLLDTDGSEAVLERIVYGGGDVLVQDGLRFNAIGRVALRLSPSGLDAYAYDFRGRLVHAGHRSLRDHRADVEWSPVNSAKRISDVEAILDAVSEPLLSRERLELRYQYDALDRPVRFVGPDGSAINYRYGAHGLPAQIGVHMSGSPEEIVVADGVRHDAAGRITGWRSGSAVSVERTLDPEGLEVTSRVTTNGAVVREAFVLHDPMGNVSSVLDLATPTSAFTYDAESKLVRAEGTGTPPNNANSHYTESYQYDAAGNVTSLEHRSSSMGWVETFEYRPDNRLRATSSSEHGGSQWRNRYQHDRSGHLIRRPDGSVLNWDIFGCLAKVDTGAAELFFSYDHEGTLVRQITEHPENVVDEMVIRGPFERRRRRRDGSVSFEQSVVAVELAGQPLAVVERITVPSDGAVQPEVRNQITDQTGSVIMELDKNGAPISAEAYRPFGTSTARKARSPLEGATKRYGFRGGRFDPESGLTYLNGRWYANNLGRYVSPDGEDESGNRYTIPANPQAPVRHPGGQPWLNSVYRNALGSYLRLLRGPSMVGGRYDDRLT